MNWTDELLTDCGNDLDQEDNKLAFAGKFVAYTAASSVVMTTELAVNVVKTPFVITKKVFNFLF